MNSAASLDCADFEEMAYSMEERSQAPGCLLSPGIFIMTSGEPEYDVIWLLHEIFMACFPWPMRVSSGWAEPSSTVWDADGAPPVSMSFLFSSNQRVKVPSLMPIFLPSSV
ncbi:hypothetical protein FQZ97_1152540 [compost metagenome]